jgi:hypothetical protein
LLFSGDFDVPSSREDVDRDSPWNQWLRNEIPMAFIDALDAFKVGSLNKEITFRYLPLLVAVA